MSWGHSPGHVPNGRGRFGYAARGVRFRHGAGRKRHVPGTVTGTCLKPPDRAARPGELRLRADGGAVRVDDRAVVHGTDAAGDLGGFAADGLVEAVAVVGRVDLHVIDVDVRVVRRQRARGAHAGVARVVVRVPLLGTR